MVREAMSTTKVNLTAAVKAAGRASKRRPNMSSKRSWKGTRVKEFNVVIERDKQGYYVASVPALPGCHTQARSLDKLRERVREAIELAHN